MSSRAWHRSRVFTLWSHWFIAMLIVVMTALVASVLGMKAAYFLESSLFKKNAIVTNRLDFSCHISDMSTSGFDQNRATEVAGTLCDFRK